MKLFIFTAMLFVGSTALARDINCSAKGLRNSNNDFNCLACACHYEARGETDRGQRLVMEVIKARAHYNTSLWGGSRVCGVVFKPNQFSGSASYGRVTVNQDCLAAAEHGVDFEGPYNHTAFHPTRVRPGWSRSNQCARQVTEGNHIFYYCTHDFTPVAKRNRSGSRSRSAR